MSDVRLQNKLMQAGITIEDLEGMDRMAMLDKYAELVLTGKESFVVKPTGATAGVGYDVELEKQRLMFQMKQWDEQRAIELARIETEKVRIDCERADQEAQRQLDIKRMDMEKEDRENAKIAEIAFRDEQLSLQHRQIKLMEEKEHLERTKEDAKVVQLKRYGDALRNSVSKLGNEPLEIIHFFDIIEKQFKELKVPDDLRVSLMKPYLNERARTLANRVEASHSADYKYVKEFLLNEFRLVPQQLLELFNTSVRQSQETFKAHITRLSMLLDYYLNSRKVTTIEELKQLLVQYNTIQTFVDAPCVTNKSEARDGDD